MAKQPGELRHRVEIQAGTETQNEFGEPVVVWATAATVWAAVEPLSGRERTEAVQVQADATIRVTMRYYPGLTTKHRLIHKSRQLNIAYIINHEERNVWHELGCTEVVQ